jgi:hypothetical protein
VVVERPPAGLPRARLQADPGLVGLRCGDDRQQPAERAVDAPGGRRRGRHAVLVEADLQGGAARGVLEHGGGAQVGLVLAVVGEQQLAQRLADGDRPLEVGARDATALEKAALAQPAVQPARRGELLGTVLEIDRVDERADELETAGGLLAGHAGQATDRPSVVTSPRHPSRG